jgi:acyl-CoA synthetase (AMP-forming)/AMP-acid ligase II
VEDPGGNLLGWLDRPADKRGVRFAGRGDSWDFWPYERLARLSNEVAAGLAAGGVRQGDLVVVALRTGPAFVGAFFGVLRAGATMCPVAPPAAFQSRAAYASHLTRCWPPAP